MSDLIVIGYGELTMRRQGGGHVADRVRRRPPRHMLDTR